MVKSATKSHKNPKIEEVIRLFGKAKVNIDAKSRLFVPAKFREELGEVFHIMNGPEGSLMLFPDARWKELEKVFNAAPLNRLSDYLFLLAETEEITLDKQGRFVLPAEMRDHSGITGEAIFVGVGSYALIMDTAHFENLRKDWNADPDNRMNALARLSG